MIVNVGCGATPTAGAVNFDNSFSVRLARAPLIAGLLRALRLIDADQAQYVQFCRAHAIDYGDCRRLPLPGGCADVLYASHILEHLSRPQAAQFLREALRILKPDGVLRIAVPDMRLLVERYLDDGDCDRLIAASLLVDEGQDRPAARCKQAIFGARGHRWMYDAGSLTALLVKNGFAGVRILSAGQTTIPMETGIDYAERAEESVYVECKRSDEKVRPAQPD